MVMEQDTPFKEIYRYFGSYRKLAIALGIRQASVSRWLKSGKIPIKRAIQIEKETNGIIKREFIRPDIFARDEHEKGQKAHES